MDPKDVRAHADPDAPVYDDQDRLRTELSTQAGRTTVVCLDCGGDRGGVVTSFLDQAGSDRYVRGHREARGHQAYTVPGWPAARDAIAMAKVHALAEEGR